MNDTPERIWLDERIAKQMPAEPNPSLADNGINQIAYIKVTTALADKNKLRDELMSQIPEEFVIQVTATSVPQLLPYEDNLTVSKPLVIAVTNLGRMFQHVEPHDWLELPGPDLGPAPFEFPPE
jgi:hypothetical protein